VKARRRRQLQGKPALFGLPPQTFNNPRSKTMSRKTDPAAAAAETGKFTSEGGGVTLPEMDKANAQFEEREARAALRASTPVQTVTVEGVGADLQVGLVVRDIDSGRVLRVNRFQQAKRYSVALHAGEVLYTLVLVGEGLAEFERAAAELKPATTPQAT
jgi:hypothetical protein